jgi:hypothetical protein
MESFVTLRALPLAAALLVASAGCSGGITPPAGPITPKVSVAEETPSASASAEMDRAAAFVKAVYLEDWDQAGSMVASNTIGARYVTHQVAEAQVDELNGTTRTIDPSDVDVAADLAARTVSVEDRSGDSPANYVWQNFAFQDNKITSWDVKGQPVLTSRLWTTKSSDKSDGVRADLMSAYQGNSKNLNVIVRLSSSSKDVRVTGAAYTPKGGFKHEDTESLLTDVDKGGKSLTHFGFNKAPVGGNLKLTIDRIDSSDTSSSYSLTTLNLQVR